MCEQGQPHCALPEFGPAVDQFDMVGFPLPRSATEASPHFRDWRVNYALPGWAKEATRAAPQHAPGESCGSRRACALTIAAGTSSVESVEQQRLAVRDAAVPRR